MGVGANEAANRADGPDRELTLSEIEAIEALERDYGVSIQRRQIVTRGVALNHLVGREFQVGEWTCPDF
jgi:hypothetical protein